MHLQLLKWFFANQRFYLFRGLHLGDFVATASTDGAC
jgi:hypothetical protein